MSTKRVRQAFTGKIFRVQSGGRYLYRCGRLRVDGAASVSSGCWAAVMSLRCGAAPWLRSSWLTGSPRAPWAVAALSWLTGAVCFCCGCRAAAAGSVGALLVDGLGLRLPLPLPRAGLRSGRRCAVPWRRPSMYVCRGVRAPCAVGCHAAALRLGAVRRAPWAVGLRGSSLSCRCAPRAAPCLFLFLFLVSWRRGFSLSLSVSCRAVMRPRSLHMYYMSCH